MCYAENLILENCEMIDTDLNFEYSTVQAEIINTVKSIKNPYSGTIRVEDVEEFILDDQDLDFENIQIIKKVS